jgi:two-component system, LytTR family, sensor kinase
MKKVIAIIKSNPLAFDKSLVIRHAISWVLITLYLSYLDPVGGEGSYLIVGTFLTMSFYVLNYYLPSLIAFPVYFLASKWHFVWINMLILLILLAIHYYTDFVFFAEPEDEQLDLFYWGQRKLFFIAIIYLVAYGFYENRKSIIDFKKQADKEKTVVKRELGFFKNQFNHHISFNFLNYCYSYALKSTDSTAHVIATYSDMLHYTLDSKADQAMPLDKEIQYIQQYIEIQQQFIPNLAVQFNTDGAFEGKKVLPRVLITFVENAFKHGVTDDKNKPIKIELQMVQNKLVFSVSNAKPQHKKQVVSTGIGNFNAKNQLDLFYENKYQLEVIEDESTYVCNLNLTIT